MNRKEAQLDKNVRFSSDECYNQLRATHIWYGPHSPYYDKGHTEECKYRHIFFPTQI